MFRPVLFGTAWVIACLTLLFAQPTFWVFVIYLGFFGFFLTVIDEGHEAKLMRAELRQVLDGQRTEA